MIYLKGLNWSRKFKEQEAQAQVLCFCVVYYLGKAYATLPSNEWKRFTAYSCCHMDMPCRYRYLGLHPISVFSYCYPLLYSIPTETMSHLGQYLHTARCSVWMAQLNGNGNMQQQGQGTSRARMAVLTSHNLSRPSLLSSSARMTQCGIGISDPRC